MAAHVAALDCGTTTVKAAVVDLRGRFKGFAAMDCPWTTLPDARIEAAPQRIARTALETLRDALQRSCVPPARVAAVSVTNQRATLICTDARGRAIGKAISWQDMRGAPQIAALRKKLDDAAYYRITGLPNHPVFSLGKMLWIKANAPELYEKTARFVLVHDYLMRQLGCEDFFCDWSNASLTGLLEVGKFRWSPMVLEKTGISASRLPALVPPGQVIGKLSRPAARLTGLLENTPLVSGGGDQQCAGLGAGAMAPGSIVVTLGTAAAALSCADRPFLDPVRRVSCCAHAVPGRWELEGLQNCAGAAIEWICGLLFGRKRLSASLERAVAAVRPDPAGILFYPYLNGSSAPHWEPRATAVFLGLALQTGRPALVRAVIEGISMETREILDVFSSAGIPTKEVRLTGGGTQIGIWNQVLADVCGKPVRLPANPHATLLGAAILAACGVRAFSSVQAAAGAMVKSGEICYPDRVRARIYERKYRLFCKLRPDFAKSNLFGRIA